MKFSRKKKAQSWILIAGVILACEYFFGAPSILSFIAVIFILYSVKKISSRQNTGQDKLRNT